MLKRSQKFKLFSNNSMKRNKFGYTLFFESSDKIQTCQQIFDFTEQLYHSQFQIKINI
ncbi:unnamed protein product [Paramecium primaurelia]|uniref:Uncharacterized protein n=1 Tax=Paramecium primaurelia TaxID=5886 RepID=A0A8S1KBU4_PARPR|nr:unnamed protein product [Paramecium primaurelia]